MHVRLAEVGDVGAMVALSGRVQERLSATGSLQEFGPIPAETVAAHVVGRTGFVLERPGRLLGGIFLEPAAAPVTRDLAVTLAGWRLDTAPSLWFLQKLMVEPREQGGGLGRVLLDGAADQVAGRGAERIVLDCWAGNDRLRDFYARAGFRLHGVFPESGYEVAVFIRAVGGHTGSS